MAELITKGLKQAKYVIDFLNEWKGAGSHSMSDVQAALLSAIQLSGLQPDAAIVDADPCNTAVLTPTLTAVVPLESKQDLKNALPKMKQGKTSKRSSTRALSVELANSLRPRNDSSIQTVMLS